MIIMMTMTILTMMTMMVTCDVITSSAGDITESLFSPSPYDVINLC